MRDLYNMEFYQGGATANGVPIDIGNPAWYYKGKGSYKTWGTNYQPTVTMKRNENGWVIESAEAYWARVKEYISNK